MRLRRREQPRGWGRLGSASGPQIQGGWFLRAGYLHKLTSGKIIPVISGEGVEISRDWAAAHFLAFYGYRQKRPGAGGCVLYSWRVSLSV